MELPRHEQLKAILIFHIIYLHLSEDRSVDLYNKLFYNENILHITW